MISPNDQIEVKVYGPQKKEISLFLPWDANIDDWKTVFCSILTYQEFSQETIKDIFQKEND